MLHYAAQQDSDSDNCDDYDEENEPEEEDEEVVEEEEVYTFQIAKTAQFPKTMISTLTHNYKAPDFLCHLQDFMIMQSIAPWYQLTLTSQIPVFKQVALKLPFLKEVMSLERKDIIHTTRAVTERIMPKSIKKAIL